MTDTAPRRPRKDAQRNRDAILEAARELFAESGDVPMYEIARRAGVGQATLYRNFPDYGAVAAALLSEVLARLEQLAAEHADDPDAFLVLLRRIVEGQARFHGLGYFLRVDDRDRSELEPLKQRLTEVIKRPLADAKAAGTIRRDLTVDDVLLVLSMIQGVLSKETDRTGQAAAVTRALALILDGLTPSRPA
jgi:AcrR family transcriptional regulator